MTPQLISQLKNEAPVLLDGAWGTQIQDRGLPPGSSGEHWNLEWPERIEEVARTYVNAGSRIILTNTFCGNRLMLATHGLGEAAFDINRAGAEISRRAARDKALVFGSIGPTGKLVLMGDTSEPELLDVFGEQASALAAGGVDGIVVETMSALDEYRCAIRAAKATGLSVVACMVFDSGPDRDRTMMGATPEQAAEVAKEEGADVIGANCGQGIEGYIPIAKRLKSACELPVWIKPNAGLPVMVDGKTTYAITPDVFARQTLDLVSAGADFVGGCCGTSPEFIAAVRAALDARSA